MELLKSHRSVRQYLNSPVPDQILEDILTCGIRSSNTGNMQLYSVVVTRDYKKKEALSPLHFNQPMVLQAPVLLTICFDINRFYKWCKLNQTATDFKNLLWLVNGTVDASILAQNICVAAEFYGLGICYLGTALYNAKEIGQILALPKGVIPITALTLGYPDTVTELVDRLPLDSIVHLEEYHDYSDSEIFDIYREKEELDSSKKFVSDNHKHNLAQVYAEVRYKSADSVFFSEKLKTMLVEQGFDI